MQPRCDPLAFGSSFELYQWCDTSGDVTVPQTSTRDVTACSTDLSLPVHRATDPSGLEGDPRRSPSPTPVPRQGHLEQVTQHIQVGFGCLQRGKLYNLRGQLFQCSASLSVKKFFLKLRWSFLCFSL